MTQGPAVVPRGHRTDDRMRTLDSATAPRASRSLGEQSFARVSLQPNVGRHAASFLRVAPPRATRCPTAPIPALWRVDGHGVERHLHRSDKRRRAMTTVLGHARAWVTPEE